MSLDGTNVYVATDFNIDAYSRNADTGALTLIQCVTEAGGGGCLNGRTSVTSAFGIAISGDGNHVYVAATNGGSVAIFTRLDADGQLAQAANSSGCWSDTGLDFPGGNASACTNAQAPLAGAENVAVSPDGGHVYVTANNAVAAVRPQRGQRRAQRTARRNRCISEDGSGGSARTATRCSPRVAGLRLGQPSLRGRGQARTRSTSSIATVTGGLSQQAGMAGCISEGRQRLRPRRGPRPAVRRRRQSGRRQRLCHHVRLDGSVGIRA